MNTTTEKIELRAWEIAEDLVNVYHMTSSQRKSCKYNVKFSQVSFCKENNFDLALSIAQAELEKNEEKIVVLEQHKRTGRYVELLAVAERDSLNHGKSWAADGYTVDKNSLNPSVEGEQVCYVYA